MPQTTPGLGIVNTPTQAVNPKRQIDTLTTEEISNLKNTGKNPYDMEMSELSEAASQNENTTIPKIPPIPGSESTLTTEEQKQAQDEFDAVNALAGKNAPNSERTYDGMTFKDINSSDLGKTIFGVQDELDKAMKGLQHKLGFDGQGMWWDGPLKAIGWLWDNFPRLCIQANEILDNANSLLADSIAVEASINAEVSYKQGELTERSNITQADINLYNAEKANNFTDSKTGAAKVYDPKTKAKFDYISNTSNAAKETMGSTGAWTRVIDNAFIKRYGPQLEEQVKGLMPEWPDQLGRALSDVLGVEVGQETVITINGWWLFSDVTTPDWVIDLFKCFISMINFLDKSVLEAIKTALIYAIDVFIPYFIERTNIQCDKYWANWKFQAKLFAQYNANGQWVEQFVNDWLTDNVIRKVIDRLKDQLINKNGINRRYAELAETYLTSLPWEIWKDCPPVKAIIFDTVLKGLNQLGRNVLAWKSVLDHIRDTLLNIGSVMDMYFIFRAWLIMQLEYLKVFVQMIDITIQYKADQETLDTYMAAKEAGFDLNSFGTNTAVAYSTPGASATDQSIKKDDIKSKTADTPLGQDENLTPLQKAQKKADAINLLDTNQAAEQMIQEPRAAKRH